MVAPAASVMSYVVRPPAVTAMRWALWRLATPPDHWRGRSLVTNNSGHAYGPRVPIVYRPSAPTSTAPIDDTDPGCQVTGLTVPFVAGTPGAVNTCPVTVPARS